MIRRLVIAAAVATLAAAALAAPTGAYKGHRVYVAEGGVATHHYRPHAIVISGDSSFFIGKLHWRSYNGAVAKGHGVTGVDNCLPDCADGHVYHNRARIRLSHPAKHCGRYFYGTLRIYWPHRKPPGLSRHTKRLIGPFSCRV